MQTRWWPGEPPAARKRRARHANGGFEARLRGSCMRYTIRTKSLHLPAYFPENARISVTMA